MSGYRAAGARAIRIDMLERLADLLRGQDTRGGFEATADMLSITGMTLEQFADLMGGLGYGAERGERAKVKPAPQGDTAPDAASSDADAAPADAVAEETPAVEAEAAPVAEPEGEPEIEVFYTFKWAPRRPAGKGPRNNAGGRKGGGDRAQGKPRGKGKPGGNRGGNDRQGAKTYSARPPKKEKPIDPDNPFAAALMGLRDKT
jgi:ATP-dependent RNA helicase SUPV3L1/SUV3